MVSFSDEIPFLCTSKTNSLENCIFVKKSGNTMTIQIELDEKQENEA